MAVLAVAGLGALGSSALGFGWQAGWLIGSAVGNAFFGPKLPDQEGPRLQDLTVSSSAYGSPIPKAYGAIRLNGNVIWASDLIEEKKTTTQGGKGGGGVQVTNYSYFANFAIGFSEGTAESAVRIWADTTLIYDSTSTTDFNQIEGLKFRFYPGSETQLPDPLIESYEGEGNVPAHRGMCYIVFERLPLAKFGNRIPNISAEIVFSAEEVQPYLITENYPSGVAPVNRMTTDFALNRTYVQGTDRRLYRLNARTMQVERQGSVAYPDTLNSLDVGPDGYLMATVVDDDNNTFVHKISSTTLAPVETSGPFSPTLFGRRDIENWLFVPVAFPSGVDYVAVGSEPSIYFSALMIHEYESAELVNRTVFTQANNNMFGIGGAKAITTGSGGGSFYAFVGDSDSSVYASGINVHTFTVKRITGSNNTLIDGWSVTSSITDFISASEIAGDAQYQFVARGGFDTDILYEDPFDGGIVMRATVLVTASIIDPDMKIVDFKWVPGVGVIWTRPDTRFARYNNWGTQRIARYTYSIGTTQTVRLFDTGSNTDSFVQNWEDVLVDQMGGGSISSENSAYNSNENSLIFYDSRSDKTAKIFINRQEAQSVSLQNIVTALCLDGGLNLSDIDTSDLAGIVVPGYVVSRTMSLRGALEPLARAFFFDVVESDGVLKFKVRGSNSVATITDDFLLLQGGSGSRINERRAMEVELPSRVSVVYADKSTDYNQGSQNAQRIATTNSSRNNVTIELPMALDGTAARRIAEKTLSSAWNGRTSYDFSTTIDFLKLDPTDVIDVSLDNGTAYKIRLTDMEIGADYSINIKGVSEYAASYQSEVEGAESEGFTPQVVSKDTSTQTILPDMPLLQDTDDLAGRGIRVYSLSSGFDLDDWSGAATFKSDDGGSSWESVARTNEGLAWGVALNALGEPSSPFKTDDENTLTVLMEAGDDQVSSITQLQMLNNGNPALLLKSNGEPEIIQFRDVTVNADGSLTLSSLLRGRRGTDAFMSGHAAGDLFVLLTQAQIDAFSLPLDDLNDPLEFKVVPNGVDFDSVSFTNKVFTGRDMKPYAPVNFSATLESDNSVTLAWFRRTRVGGGLEDGIGTVPLSETSELYDVEILNDAGSVIRTYSDITTPTMIYPSTDYAADFPSDTSTLTFRVYQKSETVGRGFPGEETVEVL